MKQLALAAGLVLLTACATPVSEVASEPVFDPPPDATEVYREERSGGGGSLPSTALTSIYVVPQEWGEIRSWYIEALGDTYDLETLSDPDSARRASILNDVSDTESYILIRFVPMSDDRVDELPAEAVSSAPEGTMTFVQVRAEKD